VTPADPPSLARLLADPASLLAFGFGAGLAPRAPGTAGTLVGVLVYWPASLLPAPAYAAVAAAAFAVGIGLCGRTARKLGAEDPPGIVWDEVAGFLVAMIAVPRAWPWVIAGFVLFRLFDVWKPWPVSLADARVKGGLGIMLDDLVAALYTLACLHLAQYLAQYLA